MKNKTIWQQVAAISFFCGITCIAIGSIDYHGTAGTVATFLILPFYLLALWCVLFKPVKKRP